MTLAERCMPPQPASVAAAPDAKNNVRFIG